MKRKAKIALGCLITFVLAGIVVFWLLGSLWAKLNSVDAGEHADSVRWLPSEATDVSYFRSYGFTAYEFTISEEGFRKWARNWEISKINGVFAIRRYNLMRVMSEQEKNPGRAFPDLAQTQISITNGYFHATPPRPNGGGTYAAYDLDTGRAYFQSNPR